MDSISLSAVFQWNHSQWKWLADKMIDLNRGQVHDQYHFLCAAQQLQPLYFKKYNAFINKYHI